MGSAPVEQQYTPQAQTTPQTTLQQQYTPQVPFSTTGTTPQVAAPVPPAAPPTGNAGTTQHSSAQFYQPVAPHGTSKKIIGYYGESLNYSIKVRLIN